MVLANFQFVVEQVDSGSSARAGLFQTPHGAVPTPAFMPVGTQGTIKGLTIDQVRSTGAQMVLGNTYHLALRPGETVVRDLGGLHGFMGWNGPILTDSGGFQLFSLAQRTKVTDAGAVFQSHIDGSRLELTPERAIQIQETLGSDVAMVLDHVVALPNSREVITDACERTVRWAARCRQAATREDQAQFAIVQGGLDSDLRVQCAESLMELDFPGYAVGGLSVGESPEDMERVTQLTCQVLPQDRPRYLMGVGKPVDLLMAMGHGIDLFDCVMPTRNGRNALAFSDFGAIRLRNSQYASDTRPLDANCRCLACRHSRGYLRHLFQANEMLGPILVSIHNLTYYQQLLAGARAAISQGRFAEYAAAKRQGWRENEETRKEGKRESGKA